MAVCMDLANIFGILNGMRGKERNAPHIKALAQRLFADIRSRGLTVGDRYLTTREVSESLEVGLGSAGKAMRHLAEQGILISKQRSGTFVGPGVNKHQHSNVQTIYVLLPEGESSATHWAFQPFIEGIRSAVPKANVQFTFVPESDPVPYVRELVESSRESGQFAGIVAVSSPPKVYRYLSELRVPAVVSGSVYSSELPLSSVDLDNRRSGQLLAQYLVDREHCRIGLLLTGIGRPGVDDFIDGIIDVLTTAGLAPNALIQRFVRDDIEALRAVTKKLLERSDHPTAVITLGSVQVDAVARVVSSLGLLVPDDVEIVFLDSDETTRLLDTTLFPRVTPKVSFLEHAKIIGNILKELLGDPSRLQHVVIPVEFHEPQRPAKQKDVD